MRSRLSPRWRRPRRKSSESRHRPLSPARRAPRVESLEDRRVLTAMLQVVHNSPYASAAEVDVYVNDNLLLDNFAFRDATPFTEVPSGTPLEIEVKGPDSDPSDPSEPAVFSATVTLADGVNYIAMAVGEPGTDFGLSIFDQGRLAATDAGQVDVLVFHGSPDAPTVDVLARDVGPLVDNLSFTEYTDDYLSVPPASYVLQITPGNDNDTVVASFEADLSGTAGAAAVVAASGFLAPGDGDPAFGLLAVFPNGDTALLPVILTGTDRNDAFLVRADEAAGALRIQQLGEGEVTVAASSTSAVILETGGGSDYVNVFLPGDGSELPALTVRGGEGRDRVVLTGTGGNDEVDIAEVGDSVNVLANGLSAGFTGIDTWYAFGRDGDDLLNASLVFSQSLILVGDDGDDTIVGGGADDRIYGGAGNDVLVGLAGDDVIYAGAGSDVLLGGSGRDVLVGGFGPDLLLGGTGNDRLYSLPFGDFVAGGPGRDSTRFFFAKNVDRLFYDGETFTPEEGFEALADRYGEQYDFERVRPWVFLDP